jgi:hypothetical protein
MPKRWITVLGLVWVLCKPGVAGAEVDDRGALALGLTATLVPVAAGGLIMTGMAVDDTELYGYAVGTYVVAGLGLALGPALAYAYMGKKLYATISAAARLAIGALAVNVMGLWPGVVLSATLFPAILLTWAIVDLALIKRVARKTNESTALAPWTDGEGAGMAVYGRF